MTVLDASVVIDGFLDRDRGKPLRDVFADATIPRISTINVAEVVDVMMRAHGLEEQEIVGSIELLVRSGLIIEPLNARQSLAAGSLRARYFDKRTRAISMADCVVIALASEVAESIASTDRMLLEVAVAEGVAMLDPLRWSASP